MHVIDESPSGMASACIWVQRDADIASVSPILLYDNASNLVKHLLAWSENKPTDWFDLNFMEKDGKYLFALIPKIHKSIERFSISFQMKYGYPLPVDIDLSILFKSLYFVSGVNNTFNSVRDLVGKSINIGIMDTSGINKDNFQTSLEKTEDSDVSWIGPFNIEDNKMMESYITSLIDSIKNN